MHGRAFSCLVMALCAASLAVAQPGAAPAPETLVELSTKAREARLKGDVPNWLALATKTLALTPDHPDILISVARAHAAAGNKQPALDHLSRAVRRGAGVDPARFAEFKSLADDPQFEAIAGDARRNLAPVGKAVPFARLPDAQWEGIAYDRVSRRWFTGSDRGEVLAVEGDGRAFPFVSGGGLRWILGLKVDAGRRLLWLVTGRYPEANAGAPGAPSDMGTGGIRAYHLETGALAAQVELDERPVLHGFNDIALAGDGTVYVTDTRTNAVYRRVPGGVKLDLLLRDSRMTFPNGIALAGDGRTLYVAHVEGVSAIDPATGSRSLLPVPADGSVNSIDGLLIHEGVLYGVQNSPYMHRIVGAALSADGRSIERVWTVASRDPAEYSQTTAAIAGDDLYMIGGSPIPDVYGGTNPAQPAPGIWRVPLGGGG